MAFLIISTVCFAIAFYIPYLWWTILLFPFFFLWSTTTAPWTAYHFIVWSFFLMALHSIVIVESLLRLPHFSFATVIICGSLLIGYLTFFCFIFLLLCHLVIQKLQPNISAALFLWAISYTLLFWLFIYYGLFPCGLSTGYPLIDPLIPIANNPLFLQPLLYFSHFFGLFLFFYTPATLILLWTKKTPKSIVPLLLCMMSWLIGWYAKKPQPPYCTREIVWMPYEFPNYPFLVIEKEVNRLISNELKKDPSLSIFVFPESAFQIDFSEYTIIPQWSDSHLAKETTILLGGIRNQNGKRYNCMYWIHNGTVKGSFDKKIPVPLVETDITFFGCNNISCSAFRTLSIAIGLNNRPKWSLTNFECIPYICSDLFLTPSKGDFFKNKPIIALCNDIYSSTPLRSFMLLMTQYKAIFWQRPILYVGYLNCKWHFP